MLTRQQKADEIRELITQVNARVAELEADGIEVVFNSHRVHITGQIKEIIIERTVQL